MKNLQANSAKEINALHTAIEQHLRSSLTKALKIGELLKQAKSDLPHGSFTNFINDTVSFSMRTAQRYQKLHDNRKQLTDADSIGEAYKMLKPKPKTDTVSDLPPEDIDVLDQIDHIRYMLRVSGCDSLIPDEGEDLMLFNSYPLDDYMDKGMEVLTLWPVKDKPSHVNYTVSRHNSDDFGYEIFNDRGGFNCKNEMLLIRVCMQMFNFAKADVGSKSKDGENVEIYEFSDESKQYFKEFLNVQNA